MQTLVPSSHPDNASQMVMTIYADPDLWKAFLPLDVDEMNNFDTVDEEDEE